jgi:MFS family permease
LARAGFAAGWRQVGACAALLGAVGMVVPTYSVLSVPLGAEFGPSRMVLMLTMTVMSLVTALLSPLFGNLMDKLSVRLLMAIGAALLVSGFFLVSFATSFDQVLIIYGLFMAPANVLTGPMIATVLLSRWFVARRGRAIGMAVAGISMAGFVFPPLTQALLESFHWREAMRVLALILAVVTVPALAMIVDSPARKGLQPDGADSAPESTRTAASAPPVKVGAILSDPAFWMIAAVFALILAGMKGMVANIVPLAVGEGITPAAGALLISIFSAAGFASKLAFASVADRLNPRHLLALAVAGFVTGMACLSFAEAGYWLMAVGVGFVGLFGGLIMPLQGILVPRIFGQQVIGRVSGLLNFVILGLLLTSPPVFGLIFDLTGSYDAIFIVFAALSAATVLMVPYIRLHPRGQAAVPPVTATPPPVAGEAPARP